MNRVYVVITDCYYRYEKGHHIDVKVFKNKEDGIKFMDEEARRLDAAVFHGDFEYRELDFYKGTEIVAGHWCDVQMGG